MHIRSRHRSRSRFRLGMRIRLRMQVPALLIVVAAALVAVLTSRVARGAPRNVVFILVDDMRFDSMSNEGHPFLRTPALDRLARRGVKFTRAFVTTSLCSPSRATILTGLYAHRHRILDNRTRLDPAVPTFPVLLGKKGYQTAFIGKWHMGGSSDEPRPGFDHWASFKGQGRYFDNIFNVDGKRRKIEGYVTDVITRMSVEWLRAVDRKKPFLLYISHKAVHAPFTPAPRHAQALADVKIVPPDSMADTPDNSFRKPRWVKEQRDSWHGVGDMYFKRTDYDSFVRDFNAAMLAVDESVGAVVKTLEDLGAFDSTLVIFTSDNGFLQGEHGLIDKRCMYEESIRVPLLVSCPELYKAGTEVDRLVLNVDIAPTILEAAEVAIPDAMQGESFLQLPRDPELPWRRSFLYEYFWERAFPETPTMFGVRTDRFKYVEYHGVWDTNELYDLDEDPLEMRNLISTPRRKRPVKVDDGYTRVRASLRKELRRLKKAYGVRLDQPDWAE